MKIQRPLFWHQGLFLQPQHFQLQDQAAQSRLIPFLKYLGPHFWGVGEMELDHGALGTGSFILNSGCFVFSDGTYVEVPGNAIVDPRLIERFLVEGTPVQIYLGLRRWNDAGENVTVIDSPEQAASASTRFVAMSDPDEIRDLHGGGPDGQIRQLHYLLRIFVEGELDQLGDYLLIPVARLDNVGGIRLSKDFIPPSLALDASEPLSRLVKEIRDLLAARSLQLERGKKQLGAQTAEPGSREMVYLLALITLNRHVPHLFHLTETSPVHPWVVYGALRQLVGELTSFSLQNGVGGPSSLLPCYDHENLWDSFSTAQDMVTQLLDEITAGPDHVVRLVNDGTYFTADLRPAQVEVGSRYFLALTSDEDSEVVCQLLEAVAKLSAREHLPLLMSHALPGLGLQYLLIPPHELPRRPQTLYFAIDHRHDQWEMVAKGRNIALYWDSAPADLEVELMILGRMQEQHSP